MKTSGIYKIVNRVNEKYYVGSSSDIKKRFYDHKRLLNKNLHNNPKLQNAWNKYEKSVWDYFIVENVHPNDLLLIEQKYLDIAKLEPDKTYNICFDATAPMRNRVHTESSKEKMSKTHKKLKIHLQFKPTEERKLHQSEVMKGRYIGSNNPNFGKTHSRETRLKMGTPNQTIFTFKNLLTLEIFTGIRSDFAKKYNFDKANLYNLIHKRSNNCRGWIIV
jgi:group I intron endonuclease